MFKKSFTSLTLLVSLVLLLLFTSCQLFFSSSVEAAGGANFTGQWQAPIMAPSARAQHGQACVQDENTLKLYIISGTAGGAPIEGLSEFDLATNSWNRIFDEGGKFSNLVDIQLFAVRDSATNSDQLIALAGRNYLTNEPSSMVQIFDSSWSEIDASNPVDVNARAASSFYTGVFQSIRGQLGTMVKGVYFYGGISTHGFETSVRALKWNKTQSAFSAMWQEPPIVRSGTLGTDFPAAVFGACCSDDPSRAVTDKFAFCFGGTNVRNDTNEVWKIDYSGVGGGSSYTKVATTGTPPTPRRLSACAFVATNKFAVIGGFDSDSGRPLQDADTYILTLSSSTAGAWTRHTNEASVSAGANSRMTHCYFSNGTFRTFLFGGQAPNNKYGDTLFSFNATANRFEPQKINQNVPAQNTKPVGRAYHNAVRDRGDIYIMNGLDQFSQSLNDIWKYDLEQESWSQVTLTGSSWTARHGASMSFVDSLIYIYGGQSSTAASTSGSTKTSTVVSDLVTIDLEDMTSTVTPDVASDLNAPPGGRYFHSSFLLMNTLVIMGGKDSSGTIRGEVSGFNVITQMWMRLYPNGNKNVQPGFLSRYGHFSLEYNTTHAVFGLGLGADATQLDLYWIYNVNIQTESFNFTAIDTASAQLASRDFVRAHAGVAIIGRYLMVCGGISSPDLLVPSNEALCYSVDLLQALWKGSSLAGIGSDWALTGASLTQIGRSIYFMFGQQSNTIALRYSFNEEVISFRFSLSSMCAFGTKFNSTACLVCNAGLRNPTCAPASKGKYIADSSIGEISCPAGTFSNVTAASSSSFCIPCPFGRYNPTPAQPLCINCPANFVCPIGSSSTIAADSPQGIMFTYTPSSAQESHPSAYSSPDIPVFPVILISSIVGFVLLIVILILLVGILSRSRYKGYYMNEKVEKQLSRVYEIFAKGRYGMTKEDLFTAFVQGREEFFPPHCIDAEISCRIFNKVNTGRSGFLTLDDFILVICTAIEFGFLEAFPKTDAVKNRKMPSPPTGIAKLRLSSYDMFEDQHSVAAVGEVNKYLKTNFGGLITLFCVVLMIALVCLTVLDFMLNLVIETKSAVPSAVIHSNFNSDTEIFTTVEAKVTYWMLLRSGLGVSTLADACVSNAAARTCSTQVSATPAGFSTKTPGSQWSTTANLPTNLKCDYSDQDKSCTVTWRCERCQAGLTANVSFLISPAVAAPIVRASVTTGTSIRHAIQDDTWGVVDLVGGEIEPSTVTVYSRPVNNNTLLSGWPATQFFFGLVNTYFEAELYLALVGHSDATFRDSGYHARSFSSPIPGNAIPPVLFSKFFDVPVVVHFTVDSTPMLVSRTLIRSLIDLVTSLLGAVSGLMSITIVALQFFDQRGKNDNFDDDEREKLKDIDDERERDAEEMAPVEKSHGKLSASKKRLPQARAFIPPSENPASSNNSVNFERVQLMMKTGLSVQQSEAILAAIVGGAGQVYPRAIPEPIRFAKNENTVNNNKLNNYDSSSDPTAAGSSSGSPSYHPSPLSPNALGINSQLSQYAVAAAAASGGGSGEYQQDQQNQPQQQNNNNNNNNLAPPSEDRLNADDYAVDPTRNDTGFFWSDEAQLFWDESSNMFFDPALQKWWNNEEKVWL